jgi:hypothetical protein
VGAEIGARSPKAKLGGQGLKSGDQTWVVAAVLIVAVGMSFRQNRSGTPTRM